MARTACVLVILLMGSFTLLAMSDEPKKTEPTNDGVGRISPGEFVETDEQGELNPAFLLKTEDVTPNIIVLSGINGWVAFACYNETKKEYRGSFEWKSFGPMRSPGGKWADLYEVRLIKQDNGNIVMTGKSKSNDFVIRATPKK
jgi:hypothetical protein